MLDLFYQSIAFKLSKEILRKAELQQSVFKTIFPDIWKCWYTLAFASIFDRKKPDTLLYPTMQIWPQCSELLLVSEVEEGRPPELAFEIRPSAPDVLARPAELVCDPCQNCSCQHESTPAAGLLSANGFAIVLGSEANCRRKHSPLKIILVTQNPAS